MHGDTQTLMAANHCHNDSYTHNQPDCMETTNITYTVIVINCDIEKLIHNIVSVQRLSREQIHL